MPRGQPRELRRAQREFDRGMYHLGYVINGMSTSPDVPQAHRWFVSATESWPEMCDAWLARYCTDEPRPELLETMLRTARTLFAERSRLRLAPDCFGGTFDLPDLDVRMPMATIGEIAGCHALTLMDAQNWSAADNLLRRARTEWLTPPLSAHDSRGLASATLVHATLHLRTSRYPDVISVLRDSDSWTDNWFQGAANFAVGYACSRLGMNSEAERRFLLAESGPNQAMRPLLLTLRALLYRGRGDDDQARALLEESYAINPDIELTRTALAGPDVRIQVISADAIASREDPWDPDTEPVERVGSEDDAAQMLREAEHELEQQIGLDKVKEQIHRLQAVAELAQARGTQFGTGARSRHLIFTGPPGTGKTTVAEIVAKMYCGLGLLASPRIVRVTRPDLVGEYLGQTAPKTRAVIDSALDGVLFIDEAYSLAQTGLHGGDAFGSEVINELLKRMEDDRDRLVVIIAGYETEIDRLLDTNEGLASRFRTRIRFPSYSAADLTTIAVAIAAGQGIPLTTEAEELLRSMLHALADEVSIDSAGRSRPRIDSLGNARFVRNVIESAEEHRAVRLKRQYPSLEDVPEERLNQLESADIKSAISELLDSL